MLLFAKVLVLLLTAVCGGEGTTFSKRITNTTNHCDVKILLREARKYRLSKNTNCLNIIIDEVRLR